MAYAEEIPMDETQGPQVTTLEGLLSVDNIAEHLEPSQLAQIGSEAVRNYRLDKSSMSDWLDRMKRGIDLATLMKEEKNYPFKGAANVKYPLITTAALQFNARAYPAIVAADQIVKTKTFGSDAQGMKAARGERVSAHMSWQLSSQMTEWEEETDKLLVQLPVVGTMVRKVWFDSVQGRPRCRVIDPGKFIVNDKVKQIDDAPRASEELSLYPSEIASRRRSGVFLDIDYQEAEGEDKQAPEEFIEQHCRLDLDEDGYEEPYIVTVHVASQKVAAVVADFEGEDVRMDQMGGVVAINRGSYFVPYHFLPSMDGGFFGTGLGLLLGDISATINSIINMMMDAGHMASLGGGFVGSEFRIKGGSQRFKPGEWKMVAASGADVSKALVPVSFPGPDATLFQLLGLLIDAGKEVASVKDIMTGDTGTKNMTATTTLALIEQGMMVFTASYKRIFRSLKREFRLIAKINSTTVDVQEYNAFHDEVDPETGQPIYYDPAQDYGARDMDIEPVADPRSVTKMQEAAKAQIVMQMAESGLVDRAEGAKRVLEAAEISDVDDLAPKPDPMQAQMAEMAMAGQQADLMLKKIEIDAAIANIDKTRSETMKNMGDVAAQEHEANLRAVQTQLEAMRDGLSGLIGNGLGGMAGQPGGGFGPQMPPSIPSYSAGGGDQILLGGQAMDGGGSSFAGPGQSPFG